MEGVMPRFSLLPMFLVLFFADPGGAKALTEYKTHLVDGNFEIRNYPARRMVEMTVVGDEKLAAYHGFRIFADPTLPPGEADDRVRLSTPVVETPAPSERFGTDPLFQIWNARAWTVSFEAPADWSPGKLASAKPPQITSREAPPTRMAVLRFDGRGGTWEEGVGWRRAAKDLMTQAARRGLQTMGPIMVAQYTAPGAQGSFSRFEVTVALKDGAPTPAPAPPIPPR